LRHYFLGGTPETLATLAHNATSTNPDLKLAGLHSPPFRPQTPIEYAQMLVEIRRCDPDLVWVGLGTPRQDFEAERISRELPVVTIAVGAAFDFASGNKAEAPTWLRGSGFEWVFRLATEPSRLWRRYSVGSLHFLQALWSDRPGDRSEAIP
jgi:N-acetylglucosaminyldiphosphoundecaprenol N-acetyl-beta-D-mannosaminyltransferase